MIMIKKIFIFFALLTCLIFLDLRSKSKNVNALESGFYDYEITISERDLDQTYYVAIYNVSNSNTECNFNYVYRTGTDFYFFTRNQNNFYLYRYNSGTYTQLTTFTSSTGILQISIDLDNTDLYLIVYSLGYDFQYNQGVEPILNGVNRTLRVRQILDNSYLQQWESGNLSIRNPYVNNYQFNFLMNYSYVDYSETLQDINNWVDIQILNSVLVNYLVAQGYSYGYDDGDAAGYSAGLSAGYSDGYSAGDSDGYSRGFVSGKTQGLNEGRDIGYNLGYADGEAGNNAVHPLWAMIRDIAGGIGDILALQLGPGITIGTIIFVPLFFSALGLILWIWRRN